MAHGQELRQEFVQNASQNEKSSQEFSFLLANAVHAAFPIETELITSFHCLTVLWGSVIAQRKS